MTALADVLDGSVGPGVYELDDTDGANGTAGAAGAAGTAAASNAHAVSAIGEQVTRHGWRFFLVDGADAHDKASFLRAMAAAFDFPDWFGNNWDALADCLNDLSWAPAPGYVLLFDHHDAYASASEWPMVLDIFTATALRWARADVAFCVLLR